MSETLLVLAAVLSFVFGWNNSSFLIGNMAGSGTVSLKTASLITALGILLGVLVEGPKMLNSLNGSLAAPVSPEGLAVTFGITIALVLALTLVDLPAPVSSAIVGAFLGVSVGLSAAVNLGQASLVVAFWFIAPILASFFAFGIRRLLSAFVSGLSLASVDSFNRIGVLAGSLAVAYTLSANNLGLIVGTAIGGSQGQNSTLTSVSMAALAVAGVFLLGKGNVSGTVGDRLLSLRPQGVLAVFASSALMVWVGTQLAIPMSISQCVFGGMLGSALSQRNAIVNPRIAYRALTTWIAVPVVAFVVGYGLAII